MNLTVIFNKPFLKRKLATAVLISASMAAFATLGDGGGDKGKKKSLLSSRSYTVSNKGFTLRSGYNYRGNNLLNPVRKPAASNYIMLNTQVTYQMGNVTYVVPLKKKVLLDKVKFTPTPPRRF